MNLNSNKKILINPITLKVEKENARAMITGYHHQGKVQYGCIFTASPNSKSMLNNFHKWPKLINVKKTSTTAKYDLSDIGKQLRDEEFPFSDKFIAVLDTVYHLKTNTLEFWKEVCNNNLFDIWDPTAPYKSLENSKQPLILLLRVYEIDHDFTDEIVEDNYYNLIYPCDINLVKPTVPDSYFTAYKKRLEATINKNLAKKEEF